MKLLFALLLFVFFAFSSLVFSADKSPRIVSLAPHLTEMIFSAGAGDLLVGVVSYSDFPELAKSIHNIGQYSAINIEEIIKLNPSLIIAWKSGDTAKELNKLEQLGFKVWLTEVENLSDIPKQIKQIGQKTNRTTIANKEAEKLTRILDALANKKHKKAPKTVFYQVWQKPLYTVGKNQFITQAIELCGAINVFGHLSLPAPKVSVEAVIKHNPDVILLGGRKQLQASWQEKWQEYPSLSAVKNEHIIKMEDSVYQRPTARFIKAIPALCANIYPK